MQMHYFGIPLIVLVILLIARMGHHRRVKIIVFLFAAVACVLLAWQLWENPAIAVLLAILAAWFAIEALLGWLVDRAWDGLKSWWRRRGDVA